MIGLVFSFKLTPNEVFFAVHMGGYEIESAIKSGLCGVLYHEKSVITSSNAYRQKYH